MAQTTFTPAAERWIPLASLTALGRRMAPRWLFAALVVTATAVGFLALEISEQGLADARDARVAANEVLQSRADAAALALDRLRIRTADLRITLADQADQLASTEGFLK